MTPLAQLVKVSVTVVVPKCARRTAMRRTTQKKKVSEGLVRRCVAEEVERRLIAKGVEGIPWFIGLSRFLVRGRYLSNDYEALFLSYFFKHGNLTNW